MPDRQGCISLHATPVGVFVHHFTINEDPLEAKKPHVPDEEEVFISDEDWMVLESKGTKRHFERANVVKMMGIRSQEKEQGIAKERP